MKRAIAESYFRMGEAEEGEKEFEKLTDEHPTWGWRIGTRGGALDAGKTEQR